MIWVGGQAVAASLSSVLELKTYSSVSDLGGLYFVEADALCKEMSKAGSRVNLMKFSNAPHPRKGSWPGLMEL